MGQCDVCSRSRETVVRASRIGPFSFAYCEECRSNKAEPYNLLKRKLRVTAKRSANSLDQEVKFLTSEGITIYHNGGYLGVEQFQWSVA